jgi:polyribonucleotide nucleotidyltransferase
VVKNIVTDKKIVEACNQIREEFEQRIINLEQKMLKTCGEQDVRKIVQKEMENRINVRDKREITNHRDVVKEEVIKLQPNTRNEDTDQEGNGKQSGRETVMYIGN